MFNKNIFEDLINKIPNFQEKTNEIRAKSEDFIHEESGAAGLVNIKMHGSRKIVSIEISDELISMNDKKMMTDILKATINSAIDKVQNEFDQRLNKSMTEFFLQSVNPSQLFSDNK